MAKFMVEYTGELECVAQHLGNSMQMYNGAPADNQGKGDTFSPTDLVATALAECSLITLAIFFRNSQIDFTGTQCEVEKIMAGQAPRRIAQIRCRYTFVRPFSLKEQQQIERVIHKCPVSLSLHPEVEQVFEFNFPPQQ